MFKQRKLRKSRPSSSGTSYTAPSASLLHEIARELQLAHYNKQDAIQFGITTAGPFGKKITLFVNLDVKPKPVHTGWCTIRVPDGAPTKQIAEYMFHVALTLMRGTVYLQQLTGEEIEEEPDLKQQRILVR